MRGEAELFQTDDMEGHLSAEGTKLEEWKWKGASKLDGEEFPHHGTADKVEYVVVTDTWKFVDTALSAEEMQGCTVSMRTAPTTRESTTPNRRSNRGPGGLRRVMPMPFTSS